VVITPPLVFLQEVPEPKLQGKTNADLALFILALQEALRLSNKDKENLRAWVENALLVNSKGND
jgi:hypothetical protein